MQVFGRVVNWREWLLGEDAKQQRYVLRTGLALSTYMTLATVAEIAHLNRLAPLQSVRMLQVISVLVGLLSYALVRSGVSRHYRDPGLTVWQMGVGILVSAWAYSEFAPIRGGMLAFQIGIVTFGAFNLPRQDLLRFSAFVVVLMTGVMATMHHLQPDRFPLGVELANGVMFLGLQPIAVVLGNQFGAMNAKLKLQRTELIDALATIRELAGRDELTGLANRRKAMACLNQSVQEFERSGASCVVVLVDLDHFKQINDSYGHNVGDKVLKRFSDLAKECLTACEVKARWGGEEFLFLSWQSTVQDVRLAMARLRQRLQEQPAVDEGRSIGIDFSAGLAVLREGDTVEKLILYADEALYQSKAHGRGCDTIHGQTVST